MARNIIGEMIEEWLSEHDSRSLSRLRGICNVSETSFRRIINGNQSPRYETILAIGAATQKWGKMQEAIAQYYPDSARFVVHGPLANPSSVVEGQNHERYLESHDATRVFLLLFTRREITREYVAQRFGDYGVSILESLKESGFAESSDGEVFHAIKERFTFGSAAHLVRFLQCLTHSIDLNDLGTHFGRMVAFAEGLNEEAARKVNTALQNCAIEIDTIVRDPDSAGKVGVAVSLLMQSIR